MPLNLTCGASLPAERQVGKDRTGYDLNRKGWADRAGFDLDFGGARPPEHGDALTAQQVVASTRAAFVVDRKAWADRAGLDLDVDASGHEAKESKEAKAVAQAPARAGWDPFADPTEASTGALAGAWDADPVTSLAAAAATGGGAPADAWDPFADPADACPAAAAAAAAPAAGAEAAASGRGGAGGAGRPQRTSAFGRQGWAQRLESARPPPAEGAGQGATIPAAVHGDPAPELGPDKGPSYEELMASLADLEEEDAGAGAGGGGPASAAASSSTAAPRQPSPTPASGSCGAVADPLGSEPESRSGAPEPLPANGSAETPDLQDLLARIDEEEREAARATQAAAPQSAAPPPEATPQAAPAKPAKKRYGGRGSWLLSVDGPPPEPRAQRPPSPPAPRPKSPPARRRPSPPPPPEPREPHGEAAAAPSAGSSSGGDTASLAAILAKLDCEEEAETSRELFRGLGQDAAPPRRATPGATSSLLGATGRGTWGSEGSMAWILRHTSQDMDMEALQRLGAGEALPADGAPAPAEPEPQPAELGGVFSGSFRIQRPLVQTRGGASAARPEPRAFGQGVPAKLRRGAA